MYKEIDVQYPGSKFILTKRKNPKIWYESICNHALRTGPSIFRKKIYGYDLPQFHKQKYIDYYENHISNVREYFKYRTGDYTEVCWTEGDNWNLLAEFLSKTKPLFEFPYENKTAKKFKGLAKYLRIIRLLVKLNNQ